MASEAAWLSNDKQGLAELLLQSHQQAFSRPLISTHQPGHSKRLICQNLFACGFPVLAHGTEQDPELSYANAAALQLCVLCVFACVFTLAHNSSARLERGDGVWRDTLPARGNHFLIY